MSDRERRLYDALKRITQYEPPDRLRKSAERKYGLSAEEVIEFAYENVLAEAVAAIKGMRRPRAASLPVTEVPIAETVTPQPSQPDDPKPDSNGAPK